MYLIPSCSGRAKRTLSWRDWPASQVKQGPAPVIGESDNDRRVTFGEAMIRLSPPSFRRLKQTTTLDVAVGGAELNVAAGVSRLGLTSAWVSCLPMNALGRMAENKARELGVDTRWIEWDHDGRMGLYFVEYGSSPRPSRVTPTAWARPSAVGVTLTSSGTPSCRAPGSFIRPGSPPHS